MTEKTLMSGRFILGFNAISKQTLLLITSLCLCLGLFFIAGFAFADTANTSLIILCYHDIPRELKLDKYGVDQELFVRQIEYLRTHGYHFVSVDDILLAQKGEKELPAKAVLLTFDDAYKSFFTFVFPLLKLYNYPSVLSVVTSWIDNPPEGLPSELMSWQEINEVAKSNLVEVASHTHDLHKAIIYNPYENTGWAATSRLYDPSTQKYESQEAFEKRVSDDIARSLSLLKEKAGVKARVLTWPYGRYNQLGMEITESLGIQLSLDIEDSTADIHSSYPLARAMVINNPPILDFIKELKRTFRLPVRQRVVQVDLDKVYDQDSQQFERNLDALIERLYAMKVSTVYLQAFCDDEGTGNVSSVYFPNRVLPMKADIFNRVVNQLAIRDIQVYAWMPILSIVLPDASENEALRVKTWNEQGIGPSESWYKRLSPFSEKTALKLCMLYEDLALNARIDGVVFLDDGYLNESEDFHPSAMEVYKKITGDTNIAPQDLGQDTLKRWNQAKINALNTLTKKITDRVRIYRPKAHFVRTLFAVTITDPQEGRQSLSQDYAQSLLLYDCVNIMAYPLMENVARPASWLKHLVKKVKAYPDGIKKTVFKLQAYDWKRKRWINTRELKKWMRILVSEGAYHIGYYPDGCIENMPKQEMIGTMMSVEDFPFIRGTQESDLYR